MKIIKNTGPVSYRLVHHIVPRQLNYVPSCIATFVKIKNQDSMEVAELSLLTSLDLTFIGR